MPMRTHGDLSLTVQQPFASVIIVCYTNVKSPTVCEIVVLRRCAVSRVIATVGCALICIDRALEMSCSVVQFFCKAEQCRVLSASTNNR